MKIKFRATGNALRDADNVAYLIITSTPCGSYQGIYDLLDELDAQRGGESRGFTARDVLIALPDWCGCKNQTLWLSVCFDIVLTWLQNEKGTR